jgi:predicted small secreted protein
MRSSILVVLALAGLLAACSTTASQYAGDDRRSGHFGAGMHAGRTAGH